MFPINSVVNKHKVTFWSVACLDEYNPLAKNSLGVLRWYAISKDHAIGLFFWNKNVRGVICWNMQIHYAFLRFILLENDYNFQHIGAPLYYSNRSTTY